MRNRQWVLALAVVGVITLGAREAGADEFRSGDLKLFYSDEGTGEPVVLVHGYRATGNLNWRLTGVIGLLAPKYRVLTIDNRGHGQSDKPRHAKDYGAHMAQDVIALLDHLKLKDAHVVGYSMGGMIALKLMAEHPERVRSAVVGGMGWMEPSGGSPGAASSDDIEQEPLVACRQAFGGLGITREQLAAIRVPMTVLIGTDDRLKARVDALARVRPDVPIIEIPGANHLNCIFRREFRDAIAASLAGHAEK